MARNRKYFNLSNKVLYQLVTTENSCVEVQRNRKHVTLFPYHLKNILSSVKESLDVDISKYSGDLDGILLGYKNIKLLSNLGTINYDSCYIHLDIEADFVVFKPVPGKELPAIVTKKSKDHVGCLVYHTFNVSLPKPEEIENWTGNEVEIGQELIIRITHANLDGKLPYIKGEFLNNVCENSSDSNETSGNKRIKFDDSDVKIEQVKKRKRHNSHEVQIDDDVVDETPISKKIKFNESSDALNVEVKKKKRKKERQSQVET